MGLDVVPKSAERLHEKEGQVFGMSTAFDDGVGVQRGAQRDVAMSGQDAQPRTQLPDVNGRGRN